MKNRKLTKSAVLETIIEYATQKNLENDPELSTKSVRNILTQAHGYKVNDSDFRRFLYEIGADPNSGFVMDTRTYEKGIPAVFYKREYAPKDLVTKLPDIRLI